MKKTLQVLLYIAAAISLLLFGTQLYFWVFDREADPPWNTIVSSMQIIQAVAAGLLILYQIYTGKQPTKTYAWVLILLLLPGPGIILYLLFGWNYRKEKNFGDKQKQDAQLIERLLEDDHLEFTSTSASRKIREDSPWIIQKSIDLHKGNDKSWLFDKNEVRHFSSGAELFPQMLDDIEAAEHHVHCEYFTFEDGKLGDMLLEAFERAVGRGVEIRILYDSIGSRKTKSKYLERLREIGCELISFMPVRYPHFNSRFNYRNHRKIMVIDGRIGYTGGFNVGDQYWWGIDGDGVWRDAHLRVVGRATHGLQAVFIGDWQFMEGELEIGSRYFPELDNVDGNTVLQLVANGPDAKRNGVLESVLHLIGAARKCIYITTPYLIPPDSVSRSLILAIHAGIDVRLLIPEKSDISLLDYSNRAFLEDLMRAGASVYLFQAGMIHTKSIVIDNVCAMIGSANMDVRSLEQNFEINMLIYDSDLASDLHQQFERDLKDSREFELSEFENRSFKQRLLESLSRLFAPIL